MFESQDTTPWYRSRATMTMAAVCIVALALALLYNQWGYRYFSDKESHYSELEQHRAQQAAQAANELPSAAVPPAATEQTGAANPNAPATTTAGAQPTTTAPAAAVNPVAPAANASDANHPTAAAPSSSSRNYWTNFRGPNRDGSYDERAVKVNWPASGLKPMWRQPIGDGFSSFVVADGAAFTIEQRRNQEVVAAYNVETGRELWTHGWSGQYTDSTGDGPRSTPTWDNGRIYAQGAEGELRCLDAKTGKLIWQRNILADNGAQNLQWGLASSPLIVDDKVVVLAGGTSGKGVAAYNKATGAPVWVSLNDRASYTSPALVTLAGKRQIMVVTANRIAGLEPADGALLWSQSWPTSMGINVSQPIVISRDRILISAGYGKGAAVFEVQGAGKSYTTKSIWENINLKTKFNSPVVHNGHAYGLDEGILTCLDLATGERKWKGGRYAYGQVLVASGHLIITNGDTGELSLVKADPSAYTEVAKFAALSGKTWNVPALAGGRLLMRNGTEMAAYNLSQ
ncbi:MAG: PQQ-binding-like beta-propeller repeat protein [Pyrinomonadaceae bacterium]